MTQDKQNYMIMLDRLSLRKQNFLLKQIKQISKNKINHQMITMKFITKLI